MWEIYEFMNNVDYHFVRWRNDQNKSCRPWWVLQLCCWWLLQPKSFAISKSCLKFLFFEIQNLNCSNQVTWKDDQNESGRCRWFLKLCSEQYFHLKSFYYGKPCLNFPNLNFEFFKTTSDGETTKAKVVELKKLCNFIVDNFFI
jgi:hypothetical protein